MVAVIVLLGLVTICLVLCIFKRKQRIARKRRELMNTEPDSGNTKEVEMDDYELAGKTKNSS